MSASKARTKPRGAPNSGPVEVQVPSQTRKHYRNWKNFSLSYLVSTLTDQEKVYNDTLGLYYKTYYGRYLRFL
jgi:hypothetical protein